MFVTIKPNSYNKSQYKDQNTVIMYPQQGTRFGDTGLGVGFEPALPSLARRRPPSPEAPSVALRLSKQRRCNTYRFRL